MTVSDLDGAIAFYHEVVGLQLAHVIAAREAALARGVRVNVISPGPVDTPTFDRMGIPGEEPRQTKEQIIQLTPRKRFAQPGEIADEVPLPFLSLIPFHHRHRPGD